MYLPPQFHSHDPAHARALMREHPLASLVSTDDEGFPFVTHLPLHAQERGDTLVLLGHCARPNPHWRYLQARREAAKDARLKQLVGGHAPPEAAQWRGLGEAFAHKMLAGIVAFELEVVELQCKLKLNQHRRESHAAMYAQYRQGDPDAQALAQWMERLGMVPESANNPEV